MININNGRNEKLLNSCRPLKDYAMFVEQVRKYGAIYDADAEIESEKLADAINNAIDSLPEDSEIKAILESRRAEVVKLCIEEYTKEHSDYVRKIEDDRKNEKISQLEKDKNHLKEESERKDKIIEKKEKQLETAVNGFVRLAKDGKLSVSEAAKYAGMSTEEFEKLM
jgi:predicted HTH domain antitoxin